MALRINRVDKETISAEDINNIAKETNAAITQLGGFYFRNNNGVFEKSINGTTWTVVDTTGGVLPDVDFLADYNSALA